MVGEPTELKFGRLQKGAVKVRSDTYTRAFFSFPWLFYGRVCLLWEAWNDCLGIRYVIASRYLKDEKIELAWALLCRRAVEWRHANYEYLEFSQAN